jgi:hypothetical protein
MPIYYLLHTESADGRRGMLMEPDLAAALAEAAQAEAAGLWRAIEITKGRETILAGPALRAAVAEERPL